MEKQHVLSKILPLLILLLITLVLKPPLFDGYLEKHSVYSQLKPPQLLNQHHEAGADLQLANEEIFSFKTSSRKRGSPRNRDRPDYSYFTASEVSQ